MSLSHSESGYGLPTRNSEEQTNQNTHNVFFYLLPGYPFGLSPTHPDMHRIGFIISLK
jgi:hypothetical protein